MTSLVSSKMLLARQGMLTSLIILRVKIVVYTITKCCCIFKTYMYTRCFCKAAAFVTSYQGDCLKTAVFNRLEDEYFLYYHGCVTLYATTFYCCKRSNFSTCLTASHTSVCLYSYILDMLLSICI